MTKIKCDVCGKKQDNITCECSNCYIVGAIKEQKKERKRIIELIDNFFENKKNVDFIDIEELKKQLTNSEEIEK